jgi:hypothetical protein
VKENIIACGYRWISHIEDEIKKKDIEMAGKYCQWQHYLN